MRRGEMRRVDLAREDPAREDTAVLTVKVHFNMNGRVGNSEIRKFRMNKNCLTFSALESKILQMNQGQLKKGIDIKYKDEDGDMVLFRCDEGLNIALEESATNGKFTIFVEENYNYGFGY